MWAETVREAGQMGRFGMTARIVIMGVAGCGKSSVGAALSAASGIPYRDGDDLHPAANVAKMKAGTPLVDADRWPWLDLVAQDLARDAPLIIGCSALKRVYRDRIRAGAGDAVLFIHLSGSREVIAARMAARDRAFHAAVPVGQPVRGTWSRRAWMSFT